MPKLSLEINGTLYFSLFCEMTQLSNSARNPDFAEINGAYADKPHRQVRKVFWFACLTAPSWVSNMTASRFCSSERGLGKKVLRERIWQRRTEPNHEKPSSVIMGTVKKQTFAPILRITSGFRAKRTLETREKEALHCAFHQKQSQIAGKHANDKWS